MTKKNILVLQSGGPTAVINQTLKGIYEEYLKNQKYFGDLYGAHYGLDGLFQEKLFILNHINHQTLNHCFELSGAALGSARVKPKETDMDRIFEVLKTHNIGFILYIGGNDTSFAAQLIRAHANKIHFDVQILHLPKTIDNDLYETDFCPGYPSSAQVISQIISGDDLDNRSFQNSVKINVVMGRHTGWLAAASSLPLCYFNKSQKNSDRIGPHLIYFPETGIQLGKLLSDVENVLSKYGRASVVVAEGIADQLSQTNLTDEVDEFGNKQLADLGHLGEFLALHIKRNLKLQSNSKLRIRADTLGYLQRSMLGITSQVDKKIAYEVGAKAVEFLLQKVTDRMVKIVRTPNKEFVMETCDLVLVAGKTRYLPKEMINAEGNFISDKFFSYIQPIINPMLPIEFLENIFVEPKLLPYQRAK